MVVRRGGCRGRAAGPRGPGRHLMDGLLHRKHQLLLVVRLEQVVQRPHRDGLPRVGKLIIAGEEQDGTVLIRFTNFACHFQPVGTGHLDIQNGRLRGFPLKNFDGFPAVLRFIQGDKVAQVLLQRLAQHLALDQLIFRHQQLTLHANHPPLGHPAGSRTGSPCRALPG